MEAPQVRLTLEAFSEPITGSYQTNRGRTGRFRGLLELVGVLECLRSDALAGRDEAAGTSSSQRRTDTEGRVGE